MFKLRVKLSVIVTLLAILPLTIWPGAAAAAQRSFGQADTAVRQLTPVLQGEEAFPIFSSYDWSDETGPEGCPDPPIFKYGTRKVHTYIPMLVTKKVSAVAAIWELDEDGNVTTEDPLVANKVVFKANTMPYVSFSFKKGTTGVFGVFYLVEVKKKKWAIYAAGAFGIAQKGKKIPQPGECILSLEEEQSGGWDDESSQATASEVPALKLNWSRQMTYEGREGQSRWCQIQLVYQNNTGRTYRWPDYQPAFQIVNADGSQDTWYKGQYYRKEDGWENGISGTPPPIPSGSSADWTWYSATNRAGQYCATAAVVFGDYIFYAQYDAAGQLGETGVVSAE